MKKTFWPLSGPQRWRRMVLESQEEAQEPRERLEVEWRLLEGSKALVRAGRPQAPLGMYPQAPKGLRARPGLLRGSWVKSARKTGLFF